MFLTCWWGRAGPWLCEQTGGQEERWRGSGKGCQENELPPPPPSTPSPAPNSLLVLLSSFHSFLSVQLTLLACSSWYLPLLYSSILSSPSLSLPQPSTFTLPLQTLLSIHIPSLPSPLFPSNSPSSPSLSPSPSLLSSSHLPDTKSSRPATPPVCDSSTGASTLSRTRFLSM